MKLFVSYWTDEKIWVSDTVYRPVSETKEIDALKVLRTPIGGKDVNRYRYQAVFKSPENASSLGSVNGMLMAPINRKKNPHFNPKKLSFTDNVCIIGWRG